MGRLYERLIKQYLDTKQVLRLDDVWRCWTSDIIVDYCSERDYHCAEQARFRAFFTDAIVGVIEPVHHVTHSPWVIKLVNLLPKPTIKFLQPGIASVIESKKEMTNQIVNVKRRAHARATGKSRDTVFGALV
ncbi:hypothetical protein N7G274_006523 [Stereocaulon virgatum]|uniref:Uncharacterized protein n=1 Tax=Stereocaulon virgatum TaxID=373712 RepID=A0ABR4A3P7_9LECA